MPIAKLLVFLIVVCGAWYITTLDLVPAPFVKVARALIVVIGLIWIVVNITGILHCCTT